MSNELKLIEALCNKLGFEVVRTRIGNVYCDCSNPNLTGQLSGCFKCQGTGVVGANFKYDLVDKARGEQGGEQ